MPNQYILIDFENVRPDLSLLVNTSYKVKVFFGAKQQEGRITYQFHKDTHALGANYESIEVRRSGKNALDMHIAYYMGRLLATEPDASIHIISGDTDFDPLVEYLASQGVSCKRTKTISDLKKVVQQGKQPSGRSRANPATRPAKASRPSRSASPASASAPPPAQKERVDDRLSPLLKHLESNQDRPSSRKKLEKFIKTHLNQRGPAATPADIEGLADELIRRGYVTQSGNKLSYTFN